MANIVYPNTFVAGQPARASEVNANFDAVSAQVNGGLSDVNLATAAVTTTKLNDLAVTTAKVAAQAITPEKSSFLNSMASATKLYFGKINTSGVNFYLPSGFSSSHAGSPTYVTTITHNFGSVSYMVVCSVEEFGFVRASLSSNSFTLTTKDVDGTTDAPNRVAFVVVKYT